MSAGSEISLTNRLAYRALGDEVPHQFPDNIRLVVWLIVNVEYWDIAGPMARTILPPPKGEPRIPDIPNWSWHEYGMRRGFWRLKSTIDQCGVTPTLSINAHVCHAYSRVAASAREGKWEFMGHSYKQGPIHDVDDEADVIKRSVDTLNDFVGRPPVGWLGPGLTETEQTLDLLSDAGIEYVGDWIVDDLPVDLSTKSGRPMTGLPYTAELNDIPMFVVQHHSASEFERRCLDQFERLYAEAENEPRILSIAVHPYISGVPHRINYFERVIEFLSGKPDVAFWTGEQIHNWHRYQS